MGVGVGVVVELGAGEGDKVVLGVADVAGCALEIATPLLHISFFPFLIHVNFLLSRILVAPCFEQIDPAFGGAAE